MTPLDSPYFPKRRATQVRWRCLCFVNKWRNLGSASLLKPDWWEMNFSEHRCLGQERRRLLEAPEKTVSRSFLCLLFAVSQSVIRAERFVCFAGQNALWCGEDVWLCLCSCICVVSMIITCPYGLPFCNNYNINTKNYYYYSYSVGSAPESCSKLNTCQLSIYKCYKEHSNSSSWLGAGEHFFFIKPKLVSTRLLAWFSTGQGPARYVSTVTKV